MSDHETSNAPTISASAIWALERLAEVRYGRETPALGWSITRELISAGLVDSPPRPLGHVDHGGRPDLPEEPEVGRAGRIGTQGSITRGVTRKSRSLCPSCLSVERNSAPSTGSFDSTGTPDWVLERASTL